MSKEKNFSKEECRTTQPRPGLRNRKNRGNCKVCWGLTPVCNLALPLFNFFRQSHSSSMGSNELGGKGTDGGKRKICPGKSGEVVGNPGLGDWLFQLHHEVQGKYCSFMWGEKRGMCTSLLQHYALGTPQEKNNLPLPKITDKCGGWEFGVSDPRYGYQRSFWHNRLQGELEIADTSTCHFIPPISTVSLCELLKSNKALARCSCKLHMKANLECRYY